MIQNWLNDNLILFTELGDSNVNIEGLGNCLVVSEKEKTLDDDLSLILTEEEDLQSPDSYLFKWGGNYYHSKEKKVKQFDILKYVGNFDDKIDLGKYPFLGVHGGYEILNGSRVYADWVKKAKFIGISTIGICERNTLAGAIKFQLECDGKGINSIIGEEVTVKDGPNTYQVKLFVKNKKGWKSLLYINREVNVMSSGRYIEIAELHKHLSSDGLIVVFDPKHMTFDQTLGYQLSHGTLGFYYQIDTVVYENEDRDEWYLNNLKEYIGNDQYKPILLSDAYYLDKEDYEAKQKLNAISGARDYKSNNQYFKTLFEEFEALNSLFNEEDSRFFDIFTESIENLRAIEKECIKFSIQTKVWHLPIYKQNEGELEIYKGNNKNLFLDLIEDGLKRKSPEGMYDIYKERMSKEYPVIVDNGFIDYFLILWDIIKWSQRQGILVGPGRGSAAGSLISYLLDITEISPIKYGLLFERFLNEGRAKVSVPDIDVDFQGSRREEVKKYMEGKYGIDQVCSVGTYTNLKLKAAFKDLCRLKNIPFDTSNYITGVLDIEKGRWHDIFKTATKNQRVKNFIIENPDIIGDMQLIMNQPKTKSVHACATLILPDEKPIYEWIPVRKEVGENGEIMLVSEWEGNELETTGFLKEDILGLKQLDKYAFMLQLIKESHSIDIDLNAIPLDEDGVYDLFKNGHNGDIFQFGSKGIAKYSKEMRPDNIEDLIAMNALYRPGPIENRFHEMYIDRKEGKSDVTYFTGSEETLGTTYGVFVYQEQIMKLCQVLGGLSLVEADDVRKAMVKKKYEALHQYKERFIPNYVEEFGVSLDYSKNVWDAIDKASTYMFNRCISGNEKIRSAGKPFKYTIGETYKLKNDRAYAKARGLIPMHDKLNGRKYGWGKSWSLDGGGRLFKNKIKDIRFEGVKELFRIVLENGTTIDVTSNHKFPTNNGEKIVDDLIIGGDKLYYCVGYVQERYEFSFTDKGGYYDSNNEYAYKHELNSKKGVKGFIKVDTEFTKLKDYKKNKIRDFCELCSNNDCRLEVHHKDGNHVNNDFDNLITVCVSCHKKEHYKMGRVKQGEKGLYSELINIVSIESIGFDEVYDVEMEAPNHTFVSGNNIVTCNSHSAAYSIMGYWGQWLKFKYPLQFWTAAFEYDPIDPKKSSIPRYIDEIRHTDNFIKIMPPNINRSGATFASDAEKFELYWSIGRVKQVGDKALEEIMIERNEFGEFFSLEEFLTRVDKRLVNKAVVINLILTGAFDELEGISFISARQKTIHKYFEVMGTTKDMPDVYKASHGDYWWQIRQKELSGFGDISYKELISTYEKLNSNLFVDGDGLKKSNPNSNVIVAGLVTKVDVRKTKHGDRYCRLFLDCNNQEIKVTMWNDYFQNIDNEEFGKEEYKMIIFEGVVVKDSYIKVYEPGDDHVIQSTENSKIYFL